MNPIKIPGAAICLLLAACQSEPVKTAYIAPIGNMQPPPPIYTGLVQSGPGPQAIPNPRPSLVRSTIPAIAPEPVAPAPVAQLPEREPMPGKPTAPIQIESPAPNTPTLEAEIPMPPEPEPLPQIEIAVSEPPNPAEPMPTLADWLQSLPQPQTGCASEQIIIEPGMLRANLAAALDTDCGITLHPKWGAGDATHIFDWRLTKTAKIPLRAPDMQDLTEWLDTTWGLQATYRADNASIRIEGIRE